jgi:hypothetical protein
MLVDKSQNFAPPEPPDRWSDFMFLREMRDRFGGNPEAHLAELSEAERARLERLNEKLKERHGYRSF